MANAELLAKLQVMQAQYAARLPDKLQAIDAALQACRDQPEEAQHVETLHRLLHTMAGAAGTFGFDGLGLQAREFEQQVKPWLRAGRCSEPDLDRLALLLPQLQVHLHEPLQMDGAHDNTAGDKRTGDT